MATIAGKPSGKRQHLKNVGEHLANSREPASQSLEVIQFMYSFASLRGPRRGGGQVRRHGEGRRGREGHRRLRGRPGSRTGTQRNRREAAILVALWLQRILEPRG